MNEFKCEGTYRADRGHEHGESKPHSVSFSVFVKDRTNVHTAVAMELRRLDPKFDSIRTLEATLVTAPAEQPPLE